MFSNIGYIILIIAVGVLAMNGIQALGLQAPHSYWFAMSLVAILGSIRCLRSNRNSR